MGRASKAVMDGMESGAGRFASSYFEGMLIRGRRWAMAFALLAFCIAGVAGLAVAGTTDSLRMHRETVRILDADGVAADAPVVGLVYREDNHGEIDQTFAVIQLPAAANDLRAKLDVTRLPDPDVDVGSSVAVIYSAADPAVVAPAHEVRQRTQIHHDEQGLRLSWWLMGSAAIPLVIALGLWLRNQPGRKDLRVGTETNV